MANQHGSNPGGPGGGAGNTGPRRAGSPIFPALLDCAIIFYASYRLWQGSQSTGWRVAFIVLVVFAALSLSLKVAAWRARGRRRGE
jgi:hypothetical protein